MRTRPALLAIAALAAALALEAWLLVGRRSGEVAYRPPAAVGGASPEIAGAMDLAQTFVPGADGLDAVTVAPLPSTIPAGAPIDLQLDAEGSDVPMARQRVRAADLLAGPTFTWTVPRVERSAARRFTLRVAAPDAVPGAGLRLAIGPPDYAWGELRVGGRGQWGDLVFSTRATHVHVMGTLRRLRRDAPWPWRTDTVLVLGLLALNAAAAAVAWYLAGGSEPLGEPR